MFFLVVVFLAFVLDGCSARSPQALHDRLSSGRRQEDDRQAGLRQSRTPAFKNAVQQMPNDPEARYQMGLATLGTALILGARSSSSRRPFSASTLDTPKRSAEGQSPRADVQHQ